MATGLTMDAAVMWVREHGARCVIVAVPVASQASINRLSASADNVIALTDPTHFRYAAGARHGYFPSIANKAARKVLAEVHHGA